MGMTLKTLREIFNKHDYNEEHCVTHNHIYNYDIVRYFFVFGLLNIGHNHINIAGFTKKIVLIWLIKPENYKL